MATRFAGIAATDGIQVANGDVVFAASGGTLDASNVVQVNFDDSVFTGQEGKQRLLAAMDLIKARIASAKVWPVTSSS